MTLKEGDCVRALRSGTHRGQTVNVGDIGYVRAAEDRTERSVQFLTGHRILYYWGPAIETWLEKVE